LANPPLVPHHTHLIGHHPRNSEELEIWL